MAVLCVLHHLEQAEVCAVVMTGGLAHVCLVTSHMTITRARIEMNIPRKRAGSSDHRKAMTRFYEAVYQVRPLRTLVILRDMLLIIQLCSRIRNHGTSNAVCKHFQ